MYKFEMKQFTITKKIAKHGKQAIIVLPKILESELKPKTIVKVTIDIIKEAEDDAP
ncbi:hypothetical protein HOF78_01210 [Candidatus Woesearchaeota archaeon]|jgi:hypothetical protein|nr:hypothetical protein [Candidatus Woesearchaeota archaeon]MBT6044999.1 hypothetical protein [Candidatus Woesearchaeota archaeon]